MQPKGARKPPREGLWLGWREIQSHADKSR